MGCPSSQQDPRPLALVVQKDMLTRWFLESYLASTYRVAVCGTWQDALVYLDDPALRVIILESNGGNGPAELDRLADNSDLQIVALVADASKPIHENVMLLEKPFPLERLASILGMPESSMEA